MDCAQFKSNIFDFTEKALPRELYDSSIHHLESCTACSRIWSEFKNLSIIIEQEKAAEPNPFAATRILQRITTEFESREAGLSPAWTRVLQPVAIAVALLCGILIGSYSAKKENTPADQLANTSGNIEFLKTNLFISEFADEDKILVLNK